MKKFTPFTRYKDLNELYQPVLIRFSFLGKYNTMAIPWAKCKDYLQDVIQASIFNKSTSIYGLYYDPEKDAGINLVRTNILVDYKGVTTSLEEINKATQLAKYLLIKCEEQLKYKTIKYTKVVQITDIDEKEKYVFHFKSDPIWQKSPILISLYTFIIRISYIFRNDYKEASLEQLLKHFVQNCKDSAKTNNKEVIEDFVRLERLANNNVLIKLLQFIKNDLKNKKFCSLYQQANKYYLHDHSGVDSAVTFNIKDEKYNNRLKLFFEVEN